MDEYTEFREIENIAARSAVEKKGKNRYGLDPQQEKYAQLRAEGMPPKECIEAVGLPIKNPTLYETKNPLIGKRIALLQDTAAEEVIERVKVDKAWVIAELLRQYESNGRVVQAFDKQGNETNAPQKANEAIKCLELLGREMGMFVEKKEVRIEHFEGVSDAELTRIAAELTAQLGLDKSTVGIEAPEGS
ncbi:MAG: hypothetical protein WKG03_00550 [Telluria sp.]